MASEYDLLTPHVHVYIYVYILENSVILAFPRMDTSYCILPISHQTTQVSESVAENGTENGLPEDSPEVLRAKELEIQAVRAAEGGSLGDALELLNRAITETPDYASPYNNRAQVRLHSHMTDLVFAYI